MSTKQKSHPRKSKPPLWTSARAEAGKECDDAVLFGYESRLCAQVQVINI